MHPMRPELDGKTVDDPEFQLVVNGREQNLFAALRDLARKDGRRASPSTCGRSRARTGGPARPRPRSPFVRYYAPLDWIIGTGRHVDDIEVAIAALTAGAEEQVSRLVRSIVLASLAAVVLAVVGVSLLTAGLTRPLGALVALSRDIAEDEKHLSRRIGLRSRDEIGQLATEFDHMAERVEASFRGVREQRELLQSVLGNVPHAIWWKDRRLVFLGCNERFAERFGLPATDAIVGKTDADLGWSEAQRVRSAARDQGVLERGEPLLDERETLRDASGRDVEGLVSRVPLRDQAGNLIGVLGVFVALPGSPPSRRRPSRRCSPARAGEDPRWAGRNLLVARRRSRRHPPRAPWRLRMPTDTDRIEKKILLRAPPERVWRAVSDSKEFGTWFGAAFDGPFVAGGRLAGRIVPTKVDPVIARGQEPFDGMRFEVAVERVEPLRLLSFRWHPYPVEAGIDDPAVPTTLVVFQLEEASGGTLLTITESGFDRLPRAAREVVRRQRPGLDRADQARREVPRRRGDGGSLRWRARARPARAGSTTPPRSSRRWATGRGCGSSSGSATAGRSRSCGSPPAPTSRARPSRSTCAPSRRPGSCGASGAAASGSGSSGRRGSRRRASTSTGSRGGGTRRSSGSGSTWSGSR